MKRRMGVKEFFKGFTANPLRRKGKVAREESEFKNSFVIFKIRKTIPHLSVIGNDPVETKKLT